MPNTSIDKPNPLPFHRCNGIGQIIFKMHENENSFPFCWKTLLIFLSFGTHCYSTDVWVDGLVQYKIENLNNNRKIEEVINEAAFINYINKGVFPHANASKSTISSSVLQSTNVSSLVQFQYTVHTSPTDINLSINQTVYSTQITSLLDTNEAKTAALGQSNGVKIIYAYADVDECTSKLVQCHTNATCVDQNFSYNCMCDFGWEGNGTYCKEIICRYGSAPPPPSKRSETTVRSHGEETLSNLQPDDYVAYGTVIVHTCSPYYELQYVATRMPVDHAVVCVGTYKAESYKDSGWAGGDVLCAVSNEFKIAIIASVISFIIILLVGSVMLVSKCSKAEKTKRRSRLQEDMDLEDVLSFRN